MLDILISQSLDYGYNTPLASVFVAVILENCYMCVHYFKNTLYIFNCCEGVAHVASFQLV